MVGRVGAAAAALLVIYAVAPWLARQCRGQIRVLWSLLVPVVSGVPPPEVEVARSSRRHKALVVDDEESNAALVRRVLAGAGYDVESTTLSRRALAMIERTAYDAVIADVKMPELSGQELYGRACQIRPEMAQRFIFITGDIDGEDTREFLDQSRCSYFLKPFNLERLIGAVDMLTGSRSADTIR